MCEIRLLISSILALSSLKCANTRVAKSCKLKSEFLDKAVLVSESDEVRLFSDFSQWYTLDDEIRGVGSILDDGDEVFMGVSSDVACAASFAVMARVNAMTGRCLAETPGGISAGSSRSNSNCIHE